MKKQQIKRWLWVLLLAVVTACGGSKGQLQGSEEGSKKKKKAKKCKIESCHVRLNHMHDGGEFKGKRGGFFTSIFAPKDPKIGQGLPKNAHKGDPHQWNTRTDK